MIVVHHNFRGRQTLDPPRGEPAFGHIHNLGIKIGTITGKLFINKIGNLMRNAPEASLIQPEPPPSVIRRCETTSWRKFNCNRPSLSIKALITTNPLAPSGVGLAKSGRSEGELNDEIKAALSIAVNKPELTRSSEITWDI